MRIAELAFGNFEEIIDVGERRKVLARAAGAVFGAYSQNKIDGARRITGAELPQLVDEVPKKCSGGSVLQERSSVFRFIKLACQSRLQKHGQRRGRNKRVAARRFAKDPIVRLKCRGQPERHFKWHTVSRNPNYFASVIHGGKKMNATIKLGRIFGIEIGLHYSWLIIALLVALSLAEQFHVANPQWGETTIWATAIVTSLLFFVAIILHELSHSAIAKLRGLPVRSITLFALGGVSQIEKDAADAKTEFWMAIFGPIASFVIGVICLVSAWALGWKPTETQAAPSTPLLAMLMWLGVINIGLAVFNMVPGFPLDGGRVLRAAIWWLSGDKDRSSRIASVVGQLVALLFIVVGILRFFNGAGFGGLWLAFIGWFLLDAARTSYAQFAITENLRGLRARDVMTKDCPLINGRDNLQTLVEEHLLSTGRRCFVVEEQGRVVGLVTIHEIKAIPRNRWPYTTVDEIMRPLDQLHTIRPETSVTEALEIMGRDDVNQIPVVTDGQLEGMISRARILQVLQTRAELSMPSQRTNPGPPPSH